MGYLGLCWSLRWIISPGLLGKGEGREGREGREGGVICVESSNNNNNMISEPRNMWWLKQLPPRSPNPCSLFLFYDLLVYREKTIPISTLLISRSIEMFLGGDKSDNENKKNFRTGQKYCVCSPPWCRSVHLPPLTFSSDGEVEEEQCTWSGAAWLGLFVLSKYF